MNFEDALDKRMYELEAFLRANNARYSLNAKFSAEDNVTINFNWNCWDEVKEGK